MRGNNEINNHLDVSIPSLRETLETRSNDMTDRDTLKTSVRSVPHATYTSRTVIEAFVFAMRQVATSITGILSFNKR